MCSKAIASLICVLGTVCLPARGSSGLEPGFEWDGTRFVIQQDHNRAVPADRKLAALVKTGEIAPVALVQQQHQYLLLLMRRPTRPLPMHRCGAGTEDRLLLLEVADGKAHLKDTLQLQSCEAGEHLDVDDPESTRDLVAGISLQGDRLSFLVVKTFADDQSVLYQYRITDRFEELK